MAPAEVQAPRWSGAEAPGSETGSSRSAEWATIAFSLFGGGLGPAAGRGWVPPLVFAAVGFLLVGLGLAVSQRAPDA